MIISFRSDILKCFSCLFIIEVVVKIFRIQYIKLPSTTLSIVLHAIEAEISKCAYLALPKGPYSPRESMAFLSCYSIIQSEQDQSENKGV